MIFKCSSTAGLGVAGSRIGIVLSAAFVVALLFTSTDGAKQQTLQIITESKPDVCDEVAEIGDEVHVQYTGFLDTGSVFDTSRQANRGPLPFTLGQGQVITGWEQGIKGMCVGEKRKLIIPPHLAYGAQGHPPTIPPGATLTFDTELVTINKKTAELILFRVLRFLVIPFAIICAVYFMYGRLKKDTHPKKRGGAAAMRGRNNKKAN